MIWIILCSLLCFLIYSLTGMFICDKIGVLGDADDILELILEGIFITFWPVIALVHLFDYD